MAPPTLLLVVDEPVLLPFGSASVAAAVALLLLPEPPLRTDVDDVGPAVSLVEPPPPWRADDEWRPLPLLFEPPLLPPGVTLAEDGAGDKGKACVGVGG